MLELDLAISPFSHLAARAAYKTTRFKPVNNKLVDKFRSRLIPSVHLEILKLYKIPYDFQVYGHGFQSFVKRQFGAGSNFPVGEAYHYYVDAVTHPNMPHKYLKRYATDTVMAVCNKMWDSGEMAFPILADALEDQEFPDHDYLNHLRTNPLFSKANFVLQFMLNKRIGWPKGMRTVRPTPRFQYQNVLGELRRTTMNHPIQSHIADLMSQFREQDEDRTQRPIRGIAAHMTIIDEIDGPALDQLFQEKREAQDEDSSDSE